MSGPTPPLRLVFAGTPGFAQTALTALHGAGHQVVLVLTQPDRPAGRGLQLAASPVKQFALAHGLPVAQPRGLRLDGRYADDARSVQAQLAALVPDVMVVAAYGLILPQWVLDLPRLGCINIHASLLPRWRGAAPIHRAVEAGDPETGVTLMQMDVGLDTGDMLLAERLPIAPDATTGSLHDALAALGAGLIVRALAAPQRLVRTPQPAQGVTYAHKIDKAEARIDWQQPAARIERQVRAFAPAPGAACSLGGERLKLLRCEIDSASSSMDAPCGTILSADAGGIVVACGQGALRVRELQRAGGKPLAAAQFLRGFALAPGRRLDQPTAAG